MAIQQHYLRILKRQVQGHLQEQMEPEAYQALLADIGPVLETPSSERDAIAQILQGIWKATNDECFGISPDPVPRGTWALTCDYMSDGETLKMALDRGQRISSFLPPVCHRLTVSREGQRIFLGIGTYVGPDDPEHFLTEFYTMLWHRFLSWCIDTPLPLIEVHFAHQQSEREHDPRSLFDCPVLYGQDSSCMVFSSHLLDCAIERSPAELQSFLKESPAHIVDIFNDRVSLRSRIRAEIHNAIELNGRVPSLEDLCQELELSPRKLRTRLAQLGTDYSRIKDEYLRNHVADLLRDPRYSIDEVVAQSGYCDSASLTRACKRWFGMPPARYRAEL
ncbi:AraC family transcriptional regulator [Parahaliea maris]|uniref:AraC family transcriptional regulator n=1 Tax=Parahaliea maris TaxID=2716870 RepID=A0A5C8ZU69_9GAMM|nr:AraC family transcriptional regulator [Parahaliea maris]TXS92045.1 AraC family transcriptional regulator [Parahaliea maris]